MNNLRPYIHSLLITGTMLGLVLATLLPSIFGAAAENSSAYGVPAAAAGPALPAIVFLDQTKAMPRKGHVVHSLLTPRNGVTNGFVSMVGIYTDTEFVITGTHTDQEMFFVLEGTGTALVGDQEFKIRPGACWLVKPGQVHGIKRDPEAPHVKAFLVHGAK